MLLFLDLLNELGKEIKCEACQVSPNVMDLYFAKETERLRFNNKKDDKIFLYDSYKIPLIG